MLLYLINTLMVTNYNTNKNIAYILFTYNDLNLQDKTTHSKTSTTKLSSLDSPKHCQCKTG